MNSMGLGFYFFKHNNLALRQVIMFKNFVSDGSTGETLVLAGYNGGLSSNAFSSEVFKEF
ncbi:hypothetical protein CHRY9390_00492 [Chryseobacterium aquaeductus]|uniref:Uncharacterized protein n=1 Tax=Chryseobacterium aquaeductus TaxID=2675056 RepID=A0A9N8ME03_9FLAO|nr:hypothetical protein CHRY9390_00492 [Chryseobacterium potabilaquae]CAD7799478.1 hypothetical protein CHRY9390_00492 [Chryseobacterium aquaeductus]